MRCRIEHIGDKGSPNLSIANFTLMPGWMSPDIELLEGTPEHDVVQQWVQEGLVAIKDPASPTGTVDPFSGAGGRSKGHEMSPEEVREYMSPTSKRRRSLALSRTERNTASHKAPVGMPFGPGRNVKVFSAEELAKGKPEPLAPPPVPDEGEVEISTGGKKIMDEEELRSKAQSKPIEEGEGKRLTPDDLKKMNKAPIEEAPEVTEKTAEVTEEAPEDEVAEETAEITKEAPEVTEEPAEEEQPPDNLMIEIIDKFVEQLSDPDMRKKDIEAMAALAEIELPSQINKTPLIALVAEELAKKGYVDLPGDE